MTDTSVRERTDGERTRRRFVRRRWARRWQVWRVVVAALAVLALLGLGLWLVYSSQLFAADEVRVSGTARLSDDRVREAAAVPLGEPLARVDLSRIESRVEAMAPVESATASRAWPDAVRIAVTEREAVAVVQIGGRLRGMDEHGVIFRGYQKPPKHLPRVLTEAETRRAALSEAADVLRAMPSKLLRRIDHVEVRTIDQIELVLRDGRRVQWGSAEKSEAKAKVLPLLLRQPGRVFDVSVPASPTASG